MIYEWGPAFTPVLGSLLEGHYGVYLLENLSRHVQVLAPSWASYEDSASETLAGVEAAFAAAVQLKIS